MMEWINTIRTVSERMYSELPASDSSVENTSTVRELPSARSCAFGACLG